MTTARSLGDLVDRAADPAKVAIIDLGDGVQPRQVTYGELATTIDAVARGVVARGLRAGDKVAILAANSAHYLAAYFGVMRAGLVAVPIGYKFPAETIHYMLRDCEARMVFTDAEHRTLCPEELSVVELGSGSDRFGGLLDPGPFECSDPGADAVAMILYTSGSTGRPKGVPLTHLGQIWVINNMAGDAAAFERHRILVAAPLYHMNGLLLSKIVAATHGTEVLLPRFRARDYIDAIERHGCSLITSVPTMLALVAKELEALARTDLSSVEAVLTGSAPLTQALVDRVASIFPGAAISNAYGTTEAGAGTFGPHPNGVPRPDLALGHPAPGVEARLVAPGAADANEGVLQLRTPALMTGYLNLPEVTGRCISEDGWYDTGDVMRRDENGFHFFVGRADDMFVCGGENIYPGEVEKMLERHPGVHQACVVPAVDAVRGNKPVAYVVVAPGHRLTEQEVKDFALANASPNEHPRNVVFVDDLPLAGTNKIDRNELVRRAGAYAETD